MASSTGGRAPATNPPMLVDRYWERVRLAEYNTRAQLPVPGDVIRIAGCGGQCGHPKSAAGGVDEEDDAGQAIAYQYQYKQQAAIHIENPTSETAAGYLPSIITSVRLLSSMSEPATPKEGRRRRRRSIIVVRPVREAGSRSSSIGRRLGRMWRRKARARRRGGRTGRNDDDDADDYEEGGGKKKTTVVSQRAEREEKIMYKNTNREPCLSCRVHAYTSDYSSRLTRQVNQSL